MPGPRHYDEFDGADHVCQRYQVWISANASAPMMKKTSPSVGFHALDRVDGVALSVAFFEPRGDEAGICRRRPAPPSGSGARRAHRCSCGGGLAGGNEQHLIERERVGCVARHHKMGAMDGVEGAAEDRRLIHAASITLQQFCFFLDFDADAHPLDGETRGSPSVRFIVSFSVVTSASAPGCRSPSTRRADSDDDRGRPSERRRRVPILRAYARTRGDPMPQNAATLRAGEVHASGTTRERKIGAALCIAESPLQARVGVPGHARHDQGSGAGEASSGSAARPRGTVRRHRDSVASIRTISSIAPQFHVLESVVEQEHAGASALPASGRFITVCATPTCAYPARMNICASSPV